MKSILTTMSILWGSLAFSQGWIGAENSVLYALDPKCSVSEVNVGIGTTSPLAQLHTTRDVLFEGLTQNEELTDVIVRDNQGYLYYRDLSGIIGNNNAWLLNGNNGTNNNNYLGTSDFMPLRIRTNNIQRMAITAAGNVGVNLDAPAVRFHVRENGQSAMGFPYESVVVERTGDTKFGVYCNSANPTNTSGVAIALGYNNFQQNNQFQGFEMQYGSWTAGNFLRFNALRRDAGGNVITTGGNPSYQNVLLLDNAGRVGVNLTNGGNVPIVPSANLHVNGTVRLANLPPSPGNLSAVVIDNNGDLFISSTTFGREENQNLKEKIEQLQIQVNELYKIISKLSEDKLITQIDR